MEYLVNHFVCECGCSLYSKGNRIVSITMCITTASITHEITVFIFSCGAGIAVRSMVTMIAMIIDVGMLRWRWSPQSFNQDKASGCQQFRSLLATPLQFRV